MQHFNVNVKCLHLVISYSYLLNPHNCSSFLIALEKRSSDLCSRSEACASGSKALLHFTCAGIGDLEKLEELKKKKNQTAESRIPIRKEGMKRV